MKIKTFECRGSSELQIDVQAFLDKNKNIKVVSTNQSLNTELVVYTILYT